MEEGKANLSRVLSGSQVCVGGADRVEERDRNKRRDTRAHHSRSKGLSGLD